MILSCLQITWYVTKETIKKKKTKSKHFKSSWNYKAEDQFVNYFPNKDGEKGIW